MFEILPNLALISTSIPPLAFFNAPSIFDPILPLINLCIGFLIGVLATWILFYSRFAVIKARNEEKQKATRKIIVDLEAGSAILENELEELRNTESILLKRQGELEGKLESQQQKNEEIRAIVVEIEERFDKSFQDLSADALRLTQEQFLTIAHTSKNEQGEALLEENKRQKRAIQQMVAPVSKSLQQMDSRLQELEKIRRQAYAALYDQVRDLTASQSMLHNETRRLVKALRQPAARTGQWGEMQLKRCVEMAGMQEHSELVQQTPDNPNQPDMIVRLPAKKIIVIDAKMPMGAYLDALEAEDDAQREDHLDLHANRIVEYIHKLASKKYKEQFSSTPEFVVLFLPSESIFSAALNKDSSLIEKGVEEGVILATPTTLIALLRAAAYGWKQEALAEKARHIEELGRELYTQLGNLAKNFSNVGRSLDSTVRLYNKAMSSLESNVLPGARRFEELGAASPSSITSEIAYSEHVHVESPRIPESDLISPPKSDDSLLKNPEEITPPQKITPPKPEPTKIQIKKEEERTPPPPPVAPPQEEKKEQPIIKEPVAIKKQPKTPEVKRHLDIAPEPDFKKEDTKTKIKEEEEEFFEGFTAPLPSTPPRPAAPKKKEIKKAPKREPDKSENAQAAAKNLRNALRSEW